MLYLKWQLLIDKPGNLSSRFVYIYLTEITANSYQDCLFYFCIYFLGSFNFYGAKKIQLFKFITINLLQLFPYFFLSVECMSQVVSIEDAGWFSTPFAFVLTVLFKETY